MDNLNCYEGLGSYCYFTSTCDFLDIWFSGYAFKIKFAGSDVYNIMPLSSLAADDGNGNCNIYL